MRCDEFEQQWNEALDEREAPQHNRALTAHAALCPHCAELLSTSDLLARAFPAHEAVVPSLGWREATVRACVVERALQGLESSPEQVVLPLASAAPASSNRWYVAVAVAAGLLIAIVAGQALNRPGNDAMPQPHPEQIVNQPAAPPVPPVLDKTSNGTPAVAPASESTLALASLNREQLSWVGYQVSDGLRPVTMGVSNAWQSIKRPLHKSEMESETPQPRENGRSSSWTIVRECYV
jgi:hypothetical protein